MMNRTGLRDFETLLRTWRGFLSDPGPGASRHDAFTSGVRTCADQLAETIARVRDDQDDDDPPPVKPLRGGIGIYGLDWTDG